MVENSTPFKVLSTVSPFQTAIANNTTADTLKSA